MVQASGYHMIANSRAMPHSSMGCPSYWMGHGLFLQRQALSLQWSPKLHASLTRTIWNTQDKPRHPIANLHPSQCRPRAITKIPGDSNSKAKSSPNSWLTQSNAIRFPHYSVQLHISKYYPRPANRRVSGCVFETL